MAVSKQGLKPSDTCFKKENVNIKGIIASEINECNQIILTELIFSELLDDIEFRDLGAILSMFSDTKPIDNKDFDINSELYNCSYYSKN